MKSYLLVYIVIGAFYSFMAKSQMTAGGWDDLLIHGPSQLGIVDSIAVDLNDDGLMDVVSASIEDGHLRAYINQGGLDFKQLYLSEDVPGIYSVSATDINQDGLIDFLFSSIETNEVIVLIAENLGYRKQVIANDILLPTDVQAGDFNRDGLMDVVSVSFESNLVQLHLQNRQGTFSSQQLSQFVERPRKLLVADFNGDMNLDIMVASSGDSSIRLFTNQGNAVFLEQLISDTMFGIRDIARCDFPNENLPAFVAAARDIDTAYLFKNDGQNMFTREEIDNNLFGVASLNCADVDGDDQPELISIASSVGSIYVHELDEITASKQLIANTRDGYVNVNVAVFEKNGSPQILTQSYFENRNLLYEPLSTNNETIVWQDFPGGAYFVSSGDFNNDQVVDLVYTAFKDDLIYWAEQQSGEFTVHLVSKQVTGPQSLSVADMDNDNDMDIISAGAWDNSFWLHRNDGSGGFTTTLIYDEAINAARTTIFDVNKDGLMDVIGTSSVDDSVRWFEQTDQGFIPHLIDNQSDGALAITHADIDQDLDEDLLVGNYFGNSISLFENLGNGNFNKRVVSLTPIKPTSIVAQDFDGDMDVDLAYNSITADSIWWNENRQNSFNNEHLISDQIEAVEDLEFIDINDDLVVDIVAVAKSTQGINVLVESNQQFDSWSLSVLPFGFRSVEQIPPQADELFRIVAASSRENSVRGFVSTDLIFADSF